MVANFKDFTENNMVFGVVCFLSLPLSLVIISSYHLQGNQTVEKKRPPHNKEQENVELRKWGKY